MGIDFNTSLGFEYLMIPPMYVEGPETWLFSLPKFQYILNFRYDEGSAIAPPPKDPEAWRIGFVQVARSVSLQLAFSKETFSHKWSEPMLDAGPDGLPFFNPPNKTSAWYSPTEGPSGQASYDVVYGRDGITVDLDANPFLSTVRQEISLVTSETTAETEPANSKKRKNPNLTLWVSDDPNLAIPWFVSGAGQLMAVREIVVMQIWLVAMTPKKKIALGASTPFTLAGWMTFGGLSDSKNRDFRTDKKHFPRYYAAMLPGDLSKALDGNLKSLEKRDKKTSNKDLAVKPVGPKVVPPPWDAKTTAVDALKAWINSLD